MRRHLKLKIKIKSVRNLLISVYGLFNFRYTVILKLLKYFFFCVFMLIHLKAQAENSTYYDQHAIGWHWYNDPKKTLKQPDEDKTQTPDVRMTAVKLALTRALDEAILEPTPQHVKNYITLQKQMSDRSSVFSRLWQYVLLQNPDLDYTIKHPANQLGTQIYSDVHNQAEDAAIHQLATQQGLFFFYRSTCPYCQRFAPILKNFSERYGIVVVPITTDGVALPEFPHSQIDQGQAQRFHVTVEPSLFTVNPYTHKAIPVAYGLMSENDLRQRLLDIATKFQGDD